MDSDQLRKSCDVQGHEGHHLEIVPSKTTGIDHLVCHTCKESLKKIVRCEVYSRVVGYLRPTSGWNKGKQAEFETRKTYEISKPIPDSSSK